MGGPAAAILLRTRLDPGLIGRVHGVIVQSATRVSGEDFDIGDAPFVVGFGPEYPEELEDVENEGVPAAFGWTPRDVVVFAAMCGRPSDHRALAELCIRAAVALDGIVDFGGGLLDLPSLYTTPGLHTAHVEGLDGSLFVTSYSGPSSQRIVTHYSDAAFLAAWMEHPKFRMVK